MQDPSRERRPGGRLPLAALPLLGALAVIVGMPACEEFPTTTEVGVEPTLQVVVEADTIRVAAAADTTVDAFVEMYQNGRDQGHLQGATIQWNPSGYVGADGVLSVPELTPGLQLVATYSDDRVTAAPDTLVVSTWPMVAIDQGPYTFESLMETRDFDAIAKDAQGRLHSQWPLEVTWISDDEGVVQVDADGVVTAVYNGGPVGIIAATEQDADTVLVEVRQRLVALDGPYDHDAIGDTVYFNGVDPGGRTYLADDLRFSSPDPSILWVDSLTGMAVTRANGTVQLRGATRQDTAFYGVTVAQVITDVMVDPTVDTLRSINATTQLSGQALDRRGQPVTGTSISWTSRDGAVASVDANGWVTALGPGTTAVVAEAAGAADSALITVRLPVDSVAVAPATLAFTALGDTTRAVASVFDATGYLLTGVPVTWASTDTLVATVDASGLVTARAAGGAVVTATAGGVSGALNVTVSQVVDTIVVIPAVDTLVALGDTVMLDADPLDANGFDVPGVAINWSSDDDLVATIGAGAVVTAIGPGTATITATDGTRSGAAVITVDQAVDSLLITPDSVGFDALGGTAVLTVEAYDSGGAAIAEPGLVWTSSDTLVVTADTAVITSVGNGTADVTAAADGVSAVVKATVQQVVVGVGVAPDSVTIDALGDTTRLTGSAVDANGYPVAGPSLTWESADTLVATVDGAGLVTGVANGVTVVRATGGAGTDSAVVTVAQRVDSVVVSPDTLTFIALHDSQEATAQPLDALGNPVAAAVTWSIQDTLVATLDTSALVTIVAESAGTTTLFATAESVTGTAAIIVEPVADSVVVSPDTLRLNAIGDTAVAAVAVFDANGNPIVNPVVTWTSSDTLVARVDSIGRVVSVVNGAAAIVAVSDSAADTTYVVVDQVEAAIVVTPATLNIEMGASDQLTAEVQDSNGVVIPGVTVAWSSADVAIATVDGGGLVTGVNVGSTTVTASAAGLNGQADVYVALPGLVYQPLTASMTGTTCDLNGAGQAYCWGYNGSGQLGDGTNTASPAPLAIPGGYTFASINANGEHACGLTPEGQAYCWGGNWQGQLGDNTYDNRSTPTAVTGGYTFKQIVTADQTTCALDLSGSAYCWGYNGEGQIGNGGVDWNRAYPTAVIGGQQFERIDGGRSHFCGLTTGGDLYCWGQGGNGQLGDDGWSDRYQPSLVSGGYTWAQFSTGSEYTCAVTTAGVGYCWGNDDSWQLGHQSGGQGAPGIAVSGALSYQLIEAGGDHTCAILTDGQTVCWGNNDSGRLGTGSDQWQFSSPQLVNTGLSFDHLALGWDYSCAMTPAGQTWCWGERNDGDIGDGVRGLYSSPVQVSTGVSIAQDGLGDPGSSTCHLGTDGLVYCAGLNWNGQLGDGTRDHRYTLAPVTGGQTFASVYVGDNSHVCGVTPAGDGYCWGANWNGQLGDGTWDDRDTPTLVTGGYTWQTVAVGAQHSCGVTTSGAVYCWGRNNNGQAGQSNTGNDYAAPQLVDDSRTYVDVGAADEHSCALTDTGDVYCWGYDNDCVGVLGDGGWCSWTTSPTLVQGGYTFEKLRVGREHVCGITTSQAAYCWGDNHRGQLGDGTTDNQASPVRAGLLLFSEIDPGGNHTCGVRADGVGVCWGGDDQGELGTGVRQDATAPTLIDSSVNFVSIRDSGDTSCGITAANELYCWGSRRGVFGDGWTHFVDAPAQVIPH